MPRIEQATEQDFALSEGALCLGQMGWTKEPTQLLLETRGLTLTEALDVIWHEQQGLLGVGELVFYQVGKRSQGFVVFHPEPDSEDDAI